ncbi:uncharacterized protein LOC142238594 [Haematobia irritans]|uniref:uncharacterized protein LOC142238594 n=1 Tax=Haematobia irritans TaxID=7368 RepID=UPI003F506D53
MKTSTIWESASRPLFVRTVWLEGSELRPGLQRHFLVDYETKRPFERLNSALNRQQFKGKDPIKSIYTQDISESLEVDYTSVDDLFQIDSAKLTLHEPIKPGTAKSSSKISRRRSSVLSRKFQSYDSYYNPNRQTNPNRRTSELSEFFSRRSSLQDLTADKQVAPDERLAERVLNWLDLAGNEDFLKTLNEFKDMEVKLTKTTKLRRDSVRKALCKSSNVMQNNGNNQNKNGFSIAKPKVAKPKAHNSSANTEPTCSHAKGSAEAMKHITIIFNKEGQPIRLNRPAKNIDLYNLSGSPGTARRLAGSLASARLYKSAENSRLNTERSRIAKVKDIGQTFGARRRLDTVADLTNSNLQKRLKDSSLMSMSYGSLHDSRKQLHIFMPTLPKKGVGMSNEDGVSELSHNFSEHCRV